METLNVVAEEIKDETTGAEIEAVNESKPAFTFNDGQQSAINSIGQSLKYEQYTRQLLLGRAGTGKTTTFQQILKDYQRYLDQIGDTRPIAICAPTNKAVKVAKKMAESKGLHGLEFSTLHSLLGLTVDEKEGSKSLSKREIEPLDDYAAIIVDEASMVDDKLTEHFFTEAAYTNVIGVGDPLQLFPVKCNCSPFFNYFERERTHTLTQVMRQQGSPAGYLVDLCGDAIENKVNNFDPRYYIEKFQQIGDGTKGSWLIKGTEFYTTLAHAMAKARDCEEWDRTRFIAYHHVSIEQINNWLRRCLYSDHAEREPFLHGEPIICLSPVVRSTWDDEQNKIIKQIKLPTATEGIILHAREVTNTVTIWCPDKTNYTYKIWLVTVQVEGMPGYIELRLLAPEVKVHYKQDLEVLRKYALEYRQWKPYYQLKEFVDDCRVAYGLTVYSSQGSTFDNVFVAGDDIARVRSQESRRRGFYVAASRGADKIIFS